MSQRDRKQLAFYAFDPVRGKGKELFRFEVNPEVGYYTWRLSPDGSRILLMPPGAPRDRFHILSLDGKTTREVVVDGWSHLVGLDWTADGKGWFVTDLFAGTGTLLYVDSEGRARKLWQLSTTEAGIIPSPDGRYLAFPAETASSNVWMVENF